MYAAEEKRVAAVEFGKALYDFKTTEQGQLAFNKVSNYRSGSHKREISLSFCLKSMLLGGKAEAVTM